jgi:hypothetical protein
MMRKAAAIDSSLFWLWQGQMVLSALFFLCALFFLHLFQLIVELLWMGGVYLPSCGRHFGDPWLVLVW